MKALIENRKIMIPFILSVVLSVFGDEISEWVIRSTSLASWIESNKIENSYRGLDMSDLFGILVLLIAATISIVIQELLEGIMHIPEIFSNDKRNNGVFLRDSAEKTDNSEKSEQEPNFDNKASIDLGKHK